MAPSTQPRQPSGTPVGGQFAGQANPEADSIDLPGDLSAAINPDQQLYRWLGEVRGRLASGEMPSKVTGPFGTHGVTYGQETGEEYATVGFCLPEGVFAEVEDGTYGQLQGLRIFLDEPGTQQDVGARAGDGQPMRSFQDVLESESSWSWTAIAAEIGKPAAKDLYERSGGSLGRAMAMRINDGPGKSNGTHADKRPALPSDAVKSALWFTAQAVRDHFDEDVDHLADGTLAEIGAMALHSDAVHAAFHDALQAAVDEWQDTHCACGNSLEDGEGYDGMCGDCADRAELAKAKLDGTVGAE